MSMDEQSATTGLVREILGKSYTSLAVRRATVEDDIEHGRTAISCQVHDEVSGDTAVIDGEGVGLVDAFFNGMIARYAPDFPSLNTVRFTAFAMEGRLATKTDFAGTDSEAEVSVEVTNSEGRAFTFRHRSRSVIGAAIGATLKSLEYFINSERAFIATYHALQDARKRDRVDLIQRYVNTLSSLVVNTSYSEVIERIRREIAPGDTRPKGGGA